MCSYTHLGGATTVKFHFAIIGSHNFGSSWMKHDPPKKIPSDISAYINSATRVGFKVSKLGDKPYLIKTYCTCPKLYTIDKVVEVYNMEGLYHHRVLKP